MEAGVIKSIKFLKKKIVNPAVGLPENIFLFVSSITPILNVDLLIKDKKGRTLLSWRDDKYCGTGWHVPGGILRFKERLEDRIKKVIEEEIGFPVRFEPVPVEINQFIIKEREERGHFVSLLYRCFVNENIEPSNTGLSEKTPGYLKWHKRCPSNIIKEHEVYRHYINGK